MLKFALFGLIRVSRFLPLAVSHVLGAALGMGYGLLSARSRRIARINLEHCLPELPAAARRRLLFRSFRELGKSFTELGAFFYWPADKLWNEVDSQAYEKVLREAHGLGRGVILAIPHLGCWELLGLYCSARFPMSSLYRTVKPRRLDSIVRLWRQRFGAKLVPLGRAGIKQLFEGLEEGEVIAILPDQDPGRRKRGVFAPFFGIQAKTSSLVVKLARRRRSPVVFSFAERLPGGQGYRLHAIVAGDGIYDAPLEEALTSVNRHIETLVRRAPEQYQWTYKRFRSRPPGEKPFFY